VRGPGCAFPSAVSPRGAIVLDAVKDTQDRQIVTIVQCADALAHYVEELHAPHRLDQFLTDAERAEVAQFIDTLAPNPETGERVLRATLLATVTDPEP
jgi:hypothetical protein